MTKDVDELVIARTVDSGFFDVLKTVDEGLGLIGGLFLVCHGRSPLFFLDAGI